jgi:hypothetical protein
MKARWFLEGTGAALLFMLPYFCPLILPLDLALYHHHLPLRSVGAGILFDLLAASVLGTLLIVAISRLRPAARRIVGACLTAFVLWRAAWLACQLTTLWHTNVELAAIPQTSAFYFAALGWWDLWGHRVAAAVLVLLPFVAWRKPTFSHPFVRATRLGLAGFAFCALWIVPQLLHVTLVSHPRRVLEPVTAKTGGDSGQRVVWILFDELSYNLIFDHRPKNLAFPNFEQLHSTSFSFGNVAPIGTFTERIIPSVLSGRPIEQIRSNQDGGLSYLDQSQHRWMSYDPSDSLFGVARAGGWNPGVAGWYNPYCRIFRTVLTTCHWRPGIHVELPIETLGASGSKSALANAMVVPQMIATKILHPAQAEQDERIGRDILDYQSIARRASELIQNGQVRFAFIHMSVPHPPGIYDRRTHAFSESGNYLDNLVLADDTLGELIEEIERTPGAAKTTVIVSSDHSWRVPIWKLGPDWTKEEENVSQGRFDPRPVFLIHFPHQSSGSEVQAPISELAEHDIIQAMLGNRISTPQNLDSFLRLSTQQTGY